jgi:ABC-type dipeptide/oligopeptide/nickel transport system permease subunit
VEETSAAPQRPTPQASSLKGLFSGWRGGKLAVSRPTSRALRRLYQNRAAVVSLIFLLLLGIAAILTPLLPLQPPRWIDTSRQFQPPSLWTPAPRWLQTNPHHYGEESDPDSFKAVRDERIREGFGQLDFLSRALLEIRLWIWGDWSVPSIFGTDKLGRDVLSRVFWGARVSLAVGIIAAFVSLVIGVTYGAVAGYIGGWVDDLLMRIVDVLYSIPFIFVVIFLITILSAETKRLQPVGSLPVEELIPLPPSNRQGLEIEKTTSPGAGTSGSGRTLLDQGVLPQEIQQAAGRVSITLPAEATVQALDPGRSWQITLPTGRKYVLQYRPEKRGASWQLFSERYERWVTANRIVIFYFVVGAIYWLTMARVVRGQVLSLKNEPFVEAARAMGASHTRILFRHIVPNLWGVIIVYLTLTIPRVMLFEAFLSFLGLGVEPPDVSWGLLANEGLQVITPIQIYWWLVLFPSLALAATLLALNFLGDGLRDALDPRLRPREST